MKSLSLRIVTIVAITITVLGLMAVMLDGPNATEKAKAKTQEGHTQAAADKPAQEQPGGAPANGEPTPSSNRGAMAPAPHRQPEFSYSDLTKAIKKKRIKTATLWPSQYEVEVALKSGNKFKVGYPPTDENLADELTAAGAKVEVNTRYARRGGFPWGLLLMIPLFGLFGYFIWKQHQTQKHGPGGINKQKAAEVKANEAPDVTFRDVAGCDEAVGEIREMADFLVNGHRYQRLGAKLPSGVILHGPPGTGKTLLAKALAGEAGVPFFAASGSDFVEMYVGVGAKRVRELFAKARKSDKGAVVFIDEIDAVGKARSGPAAGAGGNDEREGTLNQLLVELDGFTGKEKVIVVAATNRLDTLDNALLRPGRLSRHIHVSVPTEEGRLAILRVHARGKPLASDVNLEDLARMTAGASGAQLAEMLNEGAIMAAREHEQHIRHVDLWEGFLRVVAGPRKASAMLAAGERETIAYHEAGHVLCAELCPTCDETLHATINPRGQAAGFAVTGRKDRALQDEVHIHEHLIHILGGRAAEYVINGSVSSGAANDLQQANALARQAVEEFGLSPLVGQIISASQSGLSEDMKATVDSEVRRLVEDAYRDAVTLVQEHKQQLEALTQAMLSAGDIDRPEIVAAMEGVVPKPRHPVTRHAPAAGPVVADEEAVEAAPSDRQRMRDRLWLPGSGSTTGEAMAAFRASRPGDGGPAAG